MTKNFPHSLRFILRLFCSVVLLLVTACAVLIRPDSTPETKIAVLRVAAQYLDAVRAADIEAISGTMIWAAYLKDRGPHYSKASYTRELRKLKQNSSSQNHPLVNLDMKSMVVRDNSATVVLQKFNQPQSPEIQIDLYWDGNGWLITDDSLFGPGRLFGSKS